MEIMRSKATHYFLDKSMAIEKYHKKLYKIMDEYTHFIYELTKKFPKEEIYGVTSQLRRSSLSIILNYIEGRARAIGKDKVQKNFLEISYGSLKESKYLLQFSFDENYLSNEEYKIANKLAEEIGAMLWGILKNMQH